MRGALLLLLAGVVPALAAACGDGASGRPELTVAAAADLQFAFREVGDLFEEECGCRVTFIFGSSGKLTTQIESGLPADLFASADVAYVERLREKGLLLDDTQQTYAVGRLVLAVNKDSDVKAERLRDLLEAEVDNVAIANPEHAPYGVAAMEALRTEGIWEDLRPRLVYGENVRQALQYVQTGDAEAGIVALSVVDVPEVSYTVIDESLHQPLRQSMAALRRTGEEQTARDFIAFVNGPLGRPIMERYGFMLTEES